MIPLARAWMTKFSPASAFSTRLITYAAVSALETVLAGRPGPAAQ